MKRALVVMAVLAFFVAACERAADYEQAQANTLTVEQKIQGRGILWWHRHAVQARKDANARGHTIRRLQHVVRGKLAYPTGHWLDGAFLCIHRFERGAAGWQTSTGNGYAGGLQFDSQFASTYGPGWAFRTFGGVERWPASVQIAAAIQAWTTRGFSPWPNTRRLCGL